MHCLAVSLNILTNCLDGFWSSVTLLQIKLLCDWYLFHLSKLMIGADFPEWILVSAESPAATLKHKHLHGNWVMRRCIKARSTECSVANKVMLWGTKHWSVAFIEFKSNHLKAIQNLALGSFRHSALHYLTFRLDNTTFQLSSKASMHFLLIWAFKTPFI